ncbi:hypothetical protein ACEWY4_019242 [Coilia grayii]|uniref:G-protein coupled receptors family 1 profile domain-containing protein n=1 Tax=Coilia grayii TaxID=363190 RepID=A0ABD1JFK2_9TELE
MLREDGRALVNERKSYCFEDYMMRHLRHYSSNMNTTTINPTAINPTDTASTRGPLLSESPLRIALVMVYTAVLVVGLSGITLMINVLKSNLRSVTTVAVLNLIVAHLIFLPTVPFRIDYFVRNRWDLPPWVCNVASAMIFIHMYLSFIVYVVVLTLRFHSFYKRTKTEDFYRRLHSVAFSAAVWAVVLIVGVLIICFSYGRHTATHTCFNFGSKIEDPGVKEINYVISTTFVIVPCVLGAIQAHILLSITRQYGATSCSQQEFWAQMKSLCFVLVMFVCFVPYHIFRMYYLSHKHMEDKNELFLAITALSCVDLLTFVKRGACHSCGIARVC